MITQTDPEEILLENDIPSTGFNPIQSEIGVFAFSSSVFLFISLDPLQSRISSSPCHAAFTALFHSKNDKRRLKVCKDIPDV